MADSGVEDLLFRPKDDRPLAEEETVEIDPCLRPLAATAAKSAKFRLDPQTANLCIVATVLKKWVTEVKVETPDVPKEAILDLKLRASTKTKPYLMQLMPS